MDITTDIKGCQDRCLCEFIFIRADNQGGYSCADKARQEPGRTVADDLWHRIGGTCVLVHTAELQHILRRFLGDHAFKHFRCDLSDQALVLVDDGEALEPASLGRQGGLLLIRRGGHNREVFHHDVF